ncbi:MAG TPA: cellulase family glycosylhydrolase [Actinomycetota bacterium]
MRRVALLLALPLLSAPAAAQENALHACVIGELDSFTGWLEREDARGFVGETGWPDDEMGDADEWNALAEAWFDRADAAGLWVTTWATGEWWGDSYPLAPYEDRGEAPGVDTANTQAPVVEAHPGPGRGVNVAGGEFGEAPTVQPTSPFSNENPGTYDTDYHYDPQGTFDYLAAHGVRLIRLPFRWERLQREPFGPLHATELRRYRGAIGRANEAGLRVVIDPHNFGAYYLSNGEEGVRRAIGSRQVPLSAFANLWRRLSRAFENMPGVAGYGLMTEPVELPERPTGAKLWERASRAALDAIRNRGDRTLVLVPGYQWSGAQVWADVHPRGWVDDRRFRYEAHHYWDEDHSGTYRSSYADEVAAAEERGC